MDGSHWTSTKKYKRGGNGGGGHLGCSESYNWNKYKSEVTGAINSQGREQMHSTLSKLGKSLRQKNFKNFKNYLIAFFAINNLRKMKKIDL